MPGTGPPVIVTFYSNFHFIEVDVHGAFASFGGGGEKEFRTFDVHEVEVENIGPDPEEIPPEHDRFEEIAERDYTEVRQVIYSTVIFRVESTSGTWKFELEKFNTETNPFISAAINYLFDAAAIRASLSGELADPGHFHVYRETVKGGGGREEPGDGTNVRLIDRPDLGANVVEMRIYVGSGLFSPQHEATVRAVDIDLGPLIEIRPTWDETFYRVLLEEGECGGAGVPEPEAGDLQIENPCTGRRAVFHPVSGHRS